jgi:hypothetical protein
MSFLAVCLTVSASFAAGSAARGKALDSKSAQMADIVAYIKSLGKKMK